MILFSFYKSPLNLNLSKQTFLLLQIFQLKLKNIKEKLNLII